MPDSNILRDKGPVVECKRCRVYDFNYQKLLKEVKSFKRIISNQADRHKNTQIKNDKLCNELNRADVEIAKLKSSNHYWKRRARELKSQVEKYVRKG